MHLQFHTLHDLLAMGQHGAYVWSAWFISAVCLLILVISSLRARKQFYAQQQQAMLIQASRATQRDNVKVEP